MKKNYDARWMALPEREEELFDRINTKTSQRRLEQEAWAAEMYQYSDQEPEEESRVDVARLLGVAGRILLAAVFGGAVGAGLCEPAFGIIGATACAFWAFAYWRR